MRPIPLAVQTMYADLLQNVGMMEDRAGSVSRRTIKGKTYLYVTLKDGARRVQRSLGPEDDPKAQAKAAKIQVAAEQAKARRTTVAALKQARIPSPSLPLGRVLEVIANAGLFEKGIVLIGTAAYQTYACMVGAYLAGSALMTNDADLLVASFVSEGDKVDLEEVLKRANPTFKAHLNREDKLPKIYRSSDNFQVDILTKYGRGRKSPVLMEDLSCSAEALTFMEYLAEESVEAVALYGSGVLVRVPPPIRYAIHKLLVAQERRGKFALKKQKDLSQALDLIDIFLEIDADGWEDELARARKKGRSWRRNIDASLVEIRRADRKAGFKLAARRE